MQVFLQFARSQQDQIEGDSDTQSSIETGSTSHYIDNVAYTASPEQIVLDDESVEVKTAKRNLDSEDVYHTYL